MDKQRRKSIHKKAEAIFKKAEDREKAGGDHFETGCLPQDILIDFLNRILVPYNH